MTKKNKSEITNKKSGIYQVNLNPKSESVISAHFMHDINLHSNFTLYSSQEFSKSAISIDSHSIFDHIIAPLLAASDKFIAERVAAVEKRAQKNFKGYGLSSPENIGISEMITEVMFDRQFLKGPKSNCSRVILLEQIRTLIQNKKPILMVILALPYKATSPLKCRGPAPDLAEVNFLLSIAEIAKIIDRLYRTKDDVAENAMAAFTVICDGSRFNTFLNEDIEIIEDYQHQLQGWIEKLGISDYVTIQDYQNVISNYLPKDLQLEKNTIRKNVCELYNNIMSPVLNPYQMTETMNKAIELDPNPELSNPQGRFIPLFKSLIYIVKYRDILQYASNHGENYIELYTELTRHIFEPYLELSNNDKLLVEQYLANPQSPLPSRLLLLEYFRQYMLREAWNATINYIAEIRSDRDLPHEPIITCFPDHIRWTIHAKVGQLALLTTTGMGYTVQSWHGIGVFKKTKHNRIKIYTLPVIALEGSHATPILIKNISKQPFFYVHPNIKFENVEELFDIIRNNLTRNRKW